MIPSRDFSDAVINRPRTVFQTHESDVVVKFYDHSSISRAQSSTRNRLHFDNNPRFFGVEQALIFVPLCSSNSKQEATVTHSQNVAVWNHWRTSLESRTITHNSDPYLPFINRKTMMIVLTEEQGSICTLSTDRSSELLVGDQGRTIATLHRMARTASPPCTVRSYRPAVTAIDKSMTEPRTHERRAARISGIESRNTGSLRGSSCLGLSFLDINASIHIRNDFLAPRSSFRNETDIRQEVKISGCVNVSQVTRACAHARQQFQLDCSTSRINDLSYAFPVFTESEVLIGNFLGRGSTGQVNQVCGFRVKKTAIEDGIDKCSGKELGREFILNHCYRDSGDARYAIKSIRKESIKDPKVLMQGMADLNVETRFLSHLTANPHPNLIKLRAIANGDRFSPSFFILLDRLYDTLEARLDKWVNKAKKLDSPRNSLKVMFSTPNRRLSGNHERFVHGERSSLLDDQLRAVAGLSSAIAHMHKHGLMHRDIKSTNMGFNTRDDIKVWKL